MKAIQLENVSKMYRLGEVGTGTIRDDLARAWAKLRRKEDPFSKIGQVNKREEAGGDYVWALKDINLEIEAGDIVGFIGRNGAGKSTLLKLLSRVTAPTTGRICARGRIASLLEVGTGFHPELTGRENVYLNGALLGMTRREISRRLEDIVEFSGCVKYIDTPVKRYSSGMMVRLGFAVAAHLECEILIVDEVLAVGDAEFQKKCIGKMQELSSTSHRTVLFVSHNIAAVRSLCNSAVVIDRGIRQHQGSVESCVERYFESDSEPNSEILDHITMKVEEITLSRVELNGSPMHRQVLPESACTITVKVEGMSSKEVDAGLELQFHDKLGTPIAFFGPAWSTGKCPTLPRGKFSITHKLSLPLLNRSTLLVDIVLADPNRRIVARIPHGVQLECEGTPTKLGSSFNQSQGKGWFLLEEGR